MNPQPPVTRMRTASPSSANGRALADFQTVGDQLLTWKNRLAQTDWTPWLIVGFAALLRFFLLGIKPPHFDEGINGWFVDAHIIKSGFYRYDPTNYHGPLHFYVLFLSQTLLGRNLWALRLPVVLVSITCVWLTLKFEPFVGRNVSRLAALAMAVSPGFVFYGRYSIHEVWLVLFSMLFILGLLGLWRFGTTNYLWCAGMGLTGMILTKETYIIHLGCAALAIPVAWLSCLDIRISRQRSRTPGAKSINVRWFVPVFLVCVIVGVFLRRPLNIYVPVITVICALIAAYLSAHIIFAPTRDAVLRSEVKMAKQTWDYVDLGIVVATGIALIVFFYSGTFFHWDGVKGLYQAYAAWFATGQEGHGHEKPWEYWLRLLGRYEFPLVLGLVLCPFCQLFKNIGLRYLAIYGVGTLIAYSIVKYKTPWCIISFTWPLFFLFGAAILLVPLRLRSKTYLVLAGSLAVAAAVAIWFANWRDYGFIWPFVFIGAAVFLFICLMDRRATNALLIGALCVSLGSTIWLNYFRCTTDAEPYVYVQTYNDIYKLTEPVLELAKRSPAFYQLTGHIIRTSSYPLPWMLDDFPHVGYYENKALPNTLDADFLLVQSDRIQEIEAKLHNSYFTAPLTIRPYQDTSKVYFDAKRFKNFFPGRSPDFIGKESG